jgi:hypothetical protein
VKISILLSIARQVEGEYVFVRPIKANRNSEILFRYLRENDLPRTEKIREVDCIIEYGVLEDIQVDDEEQ